MELTKVCLEAIKAGRGIDLTGCNYGQTDGCCKFVARPTRYYYFLAGLVRSQSLKHIIETGTHCGGSIMSMYKGLDPGTVSTSRLVTIDIEPKSALNVLECPNLVMLQGDATDSGIVKKAAEYFKEPIDLLYIDSLHEYNHTKFVLEKYSSMFSPKYVVLDDIRLTEEMAGLWEEICLREGANALDISDMIGRRSAGFGIVRLR